MSNKIQLTPHTSISESDCPTIIKILLQKTPEDFAKYIENNPDDINLTTKYNFTVLMIACINGKLEQVKILIKVGSNINKQENFGRTALRYAIYYKHINISKLLIESGADLNLQSIRIQVTVLMAAIFNVDNNNNSEWIEIVQMIINRGADLNIQDYIGRTALMYAIIFKNIKIINMLINAGVDLNIRTNENYTALDYAKIKNNQEIIDLIKTAKIKQLEKQILALKQNIFIKIAQNRQISIIKQKKDRKIIKLTKKITNLHRIINRHRFLFTEFANYIQTN